MTSASCHRASPTVAPVTLIMARSAIVFGIRWYSCDEAHNERYKTPIPIAFSEYEKIAYPVWRTCSLQNTIATPDASPITTRPAGPIHSFSNAYFRKYETPTRTAKMPMRFSQ